MIFKFIKSKEFLDDDSDNDDNNYGDRDDNSDGYEVDDQLLPWKQIAVTTV